MPSKRVSVKGKGAELFFGELGEPVASPSNPVDAQNNGIHTEPLTPPVETAKPTATKASSESDAAAAPKKKSSSPAKQTSPKSASVSPPLSTTALDDIQRTLKRPGKEVSYIRLSADEKDRVADIVDAYRRQGLRVSETEIHRIALNYLLADYDTRKQASVLASVIASLKA